MPYTWDFLYSPFPWELNILFFIFSLTSRNRKSDFSYSSFLEIENTKAKLFQEAMFFIFFFTSGKYWKVLMKKVASWNNLAMEAIEDDPFWVTMSSVKSKAADRSTIYSILNSFGQRSQYISIKFPIHKQSENP